MVKRGVTLMEMLVVVILVGILASAGYTSYQVAIENSKARVSEHNLKTLKASLDTYIMENGDMPTLIDATFIITQIAKNDMVILKDPSTNTTPSYGLNFILARMSKDSYDALADGTAIVAECNSATFSGDGSIAKRHRKFTFFPPSVAYYGQKILKNATVVKVY